MSQENVDVILRGIEAMNRRDADAFVAHASPNVEWEDAVFGSEPVRVFRGRAELREWFERVTEPWESFHLEVDEITEAPVDRVLAGGSLTARGKASGVETQIHGWFVFGSLTEWSGSAGSSSTEPRPSKPPGCGSNSRLPCARRSTAASECSVSRNGGVSTGALAATPPHGKRLSPVTPFRPPREDVS